MFKFKSFFLHTFIKLFLVLMATELMFKFLQFGAAADRPFFGILLFTATLSLGIALVLSFLPVKVGNTLADLFGLIIAAYAITEMQFFNTQGNYMSWKAVGDGGGRIGQFVLPFIQTMPPVYWTLLIAPVLGIIFTKIVKPVKSRSWKAAIAVLVAVVGLQFGSMYYVKANDLKELYDFPKYLQKGFYEFGVTRFVWRDVLALGKEETLTLEVEKPKVIKPNASQTAGVSDQHRIISDTRWQIDAEKEGDSRIKMLDNYLMNREITDYNEMTGVCEGYNVIHIMVEALDYMALDPVLTPTLWRMKEEGFDFTNHYTPKFSCTTGESEFISLMSLIPESDVCTPNQYATNAYPQSIFSLFKARGYFTSAYHNWKDEFYERRTLYAHSNCNLYLNYDDIRYTKRYGWPSDLEMFKLTIPEWINEDHFFTHYVTSSMHFPYDEYSELGDKYVNEISKVHPDYPMMVKRYLSKSMEFDKGMEYLLGELEKAGKLENTLIYFFADHHPLYTPFVYFETYINEPGLDRTAGLNEDRTPFVMYCAGLKGRKIDTVNSTYDILPTVANMCNVSYDPRLYVGTDIFSDQEKVVIFTNGNWVTEKGIYYNSTNTFEKNPNAGDVPADYVESHCKTTEDLFKISSMIYRSDYFRYRPYLGVPGGSMHTGDEMEHLTK
ncbi:MAG: LTA synthase family protein [Erysipelotrichales bacterium]|nr:LTA synthase family protein [Erysipelotrichales bacterium]